MQRAVGYTTFPERRRAVSPESRYQARRISAACEARGMVLHKLVGDVQSYSGPDLERPGLTHALDLLQAGEATCLVVAGLDRLSRSAANLGTVIDWLEELGARLVVIDIDLDTHTDDGRLAARALVRVGTLERRRGGSLEGRELPARRGRARRHGPPRRVGPAAAPAPDRHDARQRHDPAGDRRHAQRRGRADPARRHRVASLERAGCHRVQAPGRQAEQSAAAGRGEEETA